MSTSLVLTDSIRRGTASTRIENPPAKGEIRKLRDRLLTYGRDEGRPLTEEACQFVAENVVAPAAGAGPAQPAAFGRPRPATSRSSTRPCSWTPYPDPGNGRVVGATAWPAARPVRRPDAETLAPSDLIVHPNSACEVLVQADTVRTSRPSSRTPRRRLSS